MLILQHNPLRISGIRWIRLIWILSIPAFLLVVGCNPQRTVQKYSYLLKNKKPNYPANPTNKANNHADYTKVKPTVDKRRQMAVMAAKSYMGAPYQYGGTDYKGLDCSALTQNAWSKAGIKIARSSRGQSSQGDKVPIGLVKPGDLAFFDAKMQGKITHVGMITENSKEGIYFIHATVSYGVRVDRLDKGYWRPRFQYARAVVAEDKHAVN